MQADVQCALGAIELALADRLAAALSARNLVATHVACGRSDTWASADPPWWSVRRPVVVMSASCEIAPAPWQPIEVAAGHFERAIETMTGSVVALINVFRAVTEARPTVVHEAAETIRERIRRVNAMVARLSHTRGALVVDVDSALARAGAVALGSDYRLTSEAAREMVIAEIVRVVTRESAK